MDFQKVTFVGPRKDDRDVYEVITEGGYSMFFDFGVQVECYYRHGEVDTEAPLVKVMLEINDLHTKVELKRATFYFDCISSSE